jgi:branched-chain amino acid transport system ATP-binding protein
MSLLEFKNVTKDFGGLRAIGNVSFTVDQGEIFGVIGPNGAGKTTLFNLASGFTDISSGEIWFCGSRLNRKGPHQICKLGLCRTFQIVRPFGDMTVLDNVMVGAFLKSPERDAARRKAQGILQLLDLDPLGGQLAKNLTIADRKRLEVAKAVATEPRLLLLDEVMAGLTMVETAAMVEIARKLRNQGITIMVIEHIMQAIMNLSDRILVIHHGGKIAEGAPHVIANHPEVIKAYLGDEYGADAQNLRTDQSRLEDLR